MGSRNGMAGQGVSLSERFGGFFDLLAVAFAPGNISLFFIVALAYFLSGRFGQQLAIPNPTATAFWPPAGIALAAIFLKGNKALPAIFVGALLVNLITTGSIPIASGIALGNTLQAMAGVFLVNKFANGISAFFSPRDVLRFMALAGVVPATLSATSGVSLLCLGGVVKWAQFQEVWAVWWTGDLLGAIILAPFLILVLGYRHHSLSWQEWGEAALLLGGLTTVCVLNFGPPLVSWVPKLFFSIPFLFWAAVRFCPLEVSGACLVMSSFAVWGSLHGYGPYANTKSAPLMVLGYVSVYSVMAMFTAAALSKQRKEIADLYALYFRLKAATFDDPEALADNALLLREHRLDCNLNQDAD
jgi:integral membrane sensor domain MASE1